MHRLLIIGYVWPEPDSSAAGSRMMQLIHFFLDQEYEICFATTAQKTAYRAELESLGVKSRGIELNNSSFDVFLEEYRPQAVLFDRFMMEEQFGWRVSEICPRALKILDTEDLHFLRKARETAFKKKLELTPALLHSDTAKREIASIYRCDLSLIISEKEMELLLQDFRLPKSLLFYLPLVENATSMDTALPDFEERSHFISIGNFLHEPNWDAVLRLKLNIWPLIRKQLPAAEIHIYGAYPTQKVFNLHNPSENFFIKGRAGNARQVIQKAKVLLAPLQFGAGIKGKFIDAMVTGTPSVTTTIGAEGMTTDSGWPGKVVHGDAEFAAAAIELYKDKFHWEQAREKGFQVIEDRFSSAAYWRSLKKILLDLEGNLEGHREKNFTGSMLSHHQVNSTRYLSKYIEAKNKLEWEINRKTPDL